MKKLRVLYLCSWPIGDHGKGAIDFVYDQVEALSSEVEACYVQIKFVGIFEWIRLKLKGKLISKIIHLWPEENVTAYEISCLKFSSRITKRSTLKEVLNAANSVNKILKKKLPSLDLVHTHVVLPNGILGKHISEKYKIPHIIQEHSGPFEMHLDTREKKEFVKDLLESATVISCVSKALNDRIKQFFPTLSAFSVIPNLVRTDLFPFKQMPEIGDVIKVITICNKQPVKGHEVFFESLSLLKQKGYKVKGKMIGTGNEDLYLNGLIKKFGLANDIALEGRQSKDKIAEAIEKSHIYVCSSYTETFGLALAEALSVGRPVVTTSCGGPEQFVNSSNGEAVEVGNPMALAEGIEKTWKRLDEFDPASMHHYIHTTFGLETFKKNTLSLYKSITRNGKN